MKVYSVFRVHGGLLDPGASSEIYCKPSVQRGGNQEPSKDGTCQSHQLIRSRKEPTSGAFEVHILVLNCIGVSYLGQLRKECIFVITAPVLGMRVLVGVISTS